jgi:glycosyltransferase involved in cell wall biosynthesis
MGAKIKLLTVISSLGGGGAERQMAILLKRIDRSRFVPVLCLFNRRGPYLDELPIDLPIYDLKKRSRWDLPKLVWKLATLIRAVKPDILFSKLQYTNIITVAAHKLSRQKIPLVLGEETNYRAALQYATHSGTRFQLFKWAYPQADAIVTPSYRIASLLQADLGLEDYKVKVIPNAVELDRVRELARQEVQHPFFETPEPLLVAAGRLVVSKGYPYLLKAMKYINEKIHCKLLILGEGEERESLERLASELDLSDKIAFCGFQKNPFKFMVHADVFVLPSLWESFGNVLIEAMALGVPVVATSAPYGPEEIIENGKTGLLVPPGSAEALAEAILQVLTDSGLKKKLAQGGQLAAERYDAKTIVGQYEALFAELAARSCSALEGWPCRPE